MTKLAIPDMSCSHCKATVDAAIKSVDPDATLEFDMSARTVTVQTASPVGALLACLETAGYPSTVASAG